MSMLQHSKLFMKRNASTILTCIGGVGVIATAVTAVSATPKAMKLIKASEEEKGAKLTKLEVVQVTGLTYLPTVLVGASTIACIFGANILNKRTQAALVSAYTLLDSSFKDYKKKVEELYGKEADIEIKNAIAKDKYEEEKPEIKDDMLLFYDEYSRQYFNATMVDVLQAEIKLNRNLSIFSYATLNELYSYLDLPWQPYGDILGWSAGMIWDAEWRSWVDFNHRKVVMDDGLECYILEIQTEPTPDYEDY